mmetsp:Transcript_71835/g.203792  ORF Transcript_71835/g.203792 Transcript_71835/m.203792 type:complete len:83 (-) Transcript_71835:25-273(-)
MTKIQTAFSHGFKNAMLKPRATTQVAPAYIMTASAETAIGHTVALRIAIIAEYIQLAEPGVSADGNFQRTIQIVEIASALQS